MQKLKSYLHRQDLTLSELGRQLDLSKQTLSRRMEWKFGYKEIDGEKHPAWINRQGKLSVDRYESK